MAQLRSKSSPIQVGALTNWAQVTAGSSSHTACRHNWREQLLCLGEGNYLDNLAIIALSAAPALYKLVL
jgi:hypothetical protein